MNTKYSTNKCELCKKDSHFLVPKYSNKKGFIGWKMVCRVCYARLDDSNREGPK